MNRKLVLLFLVLSSVSCLVGQEIVYKKGDSLTVFALSGLKLRMQGLLAGQVLASMKFGEQIMVLDGPVKGQNRPDSIEGFSGNWIKVKYKALEGYAFDGFLSSLPVPKMNYRDRIKTKEEQAEYEDYAGQEMETALSEYIDKEFQRICEPLEYYNGSDGEGFQDIKLQKLNRGFTEIKIGGWEGGGTELLMPYVRLAEVKNLILILGFKSGITTEMFQELQANLQKISDDGHWSKPVFSSNMFDIEIKKYPVEDHGIQKWSIVFYWASS